MPRQWRVSITCVLNRKNGFAQRAKLSRKLRCRKGTKSNFRDKGFIGFENFVMLYIITKFIFHKSKKGFAISHL